MGLSFHCGGIRPARRHHRLHVHPILAPRVSGDGCNPITAAINRLYAKFMHKNQAQVQEALAAANSVAQEAIGAMRTVRSFAMEDGEHRRYRSGRRPLRSDRAPVHDPEFYYMFCNTFLINTVVQAALLGYGTWLVKHALVEPHILLAFMLYQGQLQEYFQNLFNSFTSP